MWSVMLKLFWGAFEMKVQARCVVFALAAGACLVAVAPMISGSRAHAADMPLKATEAIANDWWFHGDLEIGGRFFLNDPQQHGVASEGGRSLAKFYEYQDLRPGVFGNFDLSTGTNNGVYKVDAWGTNVGYDDQHLELNASKAGEHYFNFIWDETPHEYSDSAQTIYNGVGTTSLTVPAALRQQLWNDCAPCNGNITAAQAANIQRDITANLHETDLGIRRDTAAADWRWTPDPAWDIKADYSHMRRFGTQVDGIVWNSGSGVASQVPRPVDDTTQNFGASGEYQGTSPWGKLFTFKVGYDGSVYTDDFDSYTVDNPFCNFGAAPVACARGSGNASTALVSTWPSNHSDGFNATLAADLPWKSRYMGTVSYDMMRQNDAFLPFTNNPYLGVAPNGQPFNSTAALPALSLNGAVNTLLSNNVLTTQLTPALSSKLSYRYYDFDNQTPQLYFPDWIVTDTVSAVAHGGGYAPVQNVLISYIKQNADGGLNWRPNRHWNLGADYLYERYDWTHADVNVTNENSGKFYADWTPYVWITARASWLYGVRHYDNYDYLGYVGLYQWPTANADPQYSIAMRQFYLDDRERNKGKFSVAVRVAEGLTITPTFAFLDDVYNLTSSEVGLTRNHKWSAGVDMAYAVNPALTLTFSYMNEQSTQTLRATTAVNTEALTPANTYSADVKSTVNTFVGSIDYTAIPDQLDLKLSYSVSLAKDSQPVVWGIVPNNFNQYPDVHTTWSRLDAVSTYTFDKDFVRNAGLTGKMYFKLHYIWERNSVDNWQSDEMQVYMYGGPYGSGSGYQTWLAYDNPNYNVHVLMASLGFKW